MKKVLIVEDDPHLRRLFRVLFEQAGLEVFEAEDGLLGIEAALREKPDCIVSDSMMPRMSGIDMLLKLRGQSPQPVPAIFVTAAAEAPDESTQKEAGIVEVVAKPFDFDRLTALVKRCAEAH
jgi:DNA-binding response OmpR family regulator